MPRKTAGRKYPHVTTDAKPHNHQMCPVLEAIVAKVQAGDEDWGHVHEWHVATEADAKAIRTGFYAARYCRAITKALGEPVSIRANIEPAEDTWRITLQAWPRSVAKLEIARRVRNGEQLAYNVMKETP